MDDSLNTVNAEALNTEVQSFVKEAFSDPKKACTKTEWTTKNDKDIS